MYIAQHAFLGGYSRVHIAQHASLGGYSRGIYTPGMPPWVGIREGIMQKEPPSLLGRGNHAGRELLSLCTPGTMVGIHLWVYSTLHHPGYTVLPHPLPHCPTRRCRRSPLTALAQRVAERTVSVEGVSVSPLVPLSRWLFPFHCWASYCWVRRPCAVGGEEGVHSVDKTAPSRPPPVSLLGF